MINAESFIIMNMVKRRSKVKVKGKLLVGLSLLATTVFCFADCPSAKAVPNMPILSSTIADLAQAVAPAVVNIEVNQEVSLPVMNLPFGNFDFYFNGQRVSPQPNNRPGPGAPNGPFREQHNTGSGFIVRNDGYIVTNRHVVHGASKIKITLADKRVFEGKVVGTDNFSDLAVIKIEAANLPVVQLGTSGTLRPGDFVIAIGSPLGYDHTVTFGIISAVGRTVTDINGNINFIQTDAPINPGNSGGPLINLDGGVVGVSTAIQANAQNIGFCIPIDVAKSVIDDLIAHRKIFRPWLGLKLADVGEVMAKSLGLPATTKGVLIAQVFDGSPAQAAGLEQGDIIQKIDGKDVSTGKEVQDIVRGHKVTETLNLFILHNKMGKAVAVNIGQYPDKSAEELSANPKEQGDQ
jgi:serine protease Do